MSNLQIPVVNQAQTGSSNQCLTGCYYQLVQSPGPQGTNVLNLIPLLNSKDNAIPVLAASTVPNARSVNIQQPITLALPSAVSNVSLPYQVNAPLVQQLGTGKYIITTQKSPAETSKTIRVNSTVSAPQGTAVVLEKSGLNLPSTSTPGAQTFIMMNSKSQSVPVNTVPLLPSGHGLKIPANAEVKTVPASSLPFSIQQRILPQLNSSDTTKIPSVIYVSPVNTVKTSNNKTPPASPKPSNSASPIVKNSPLISTPAPTSQPSKTEPSKGPMKWVVQESKESAACIVPVTSSNNTASKLLKMISGTKAEDINLSNTSTSQIVQIKENALVVCNNKIYLLTKQGAELRGRDNIKPGTSSKTSAPSEQKGDPSVLPTESVLLTNVCFPTQKQTVNPSKAPVPSPDADSAAKSRTCTPLKTNGKASEVIYIDDDMESIPKPQAPLQNLQEQTSFIKSSIPSTPLVCGSNRKNDQLNSQPNKSSPINVCSATAPPACGSNIKDDHIRSRSNKTGSKNVCLTTPSDCGSNNKDDQVKAKDEHSMKGKDPVKIMDDRSLRKKFGLVKEVKIILKRVPLLGLENSSDSRRPSNPGSSSNLREDVKAYAESQDKRKSTFPEMDSSPKRRKSADPDLNQNTLKSNYSPSTSSSTAPVSASSSHVTKQSDQRQCISPVLNETETETNHSSESVTEMYIDPSESYSYYCEQDIAGHFSEVSAPSQKPVIENSAYPDETTKDEKIQRLKEVLKEREQALEALRRLKRN